MIVLGQVKIQKRTFKMVVVHENVFILQTAFWRGQIAFVCRGQKAQESSCQIKVSQILKSRLYPSDQSFSFLDQGTKKHISF